MDALWNAAARLHLEIGSANLACDFLLTGNVLGLALTLLMTNPNRCYFPVTLFVPFVTGRQFWRLTVYLLFLPLQAPRLPPWNLDACCEVGIVTLNLCVVSLPMHLTLDAEKFLSFPSQSIFHVIRDIFQQWRILLKSQSSFFFHFKLILI